MTAIRVLLAATIGWLALPELGWAFYNPETGRWLNRDPIEENGGANAYSGAENNPIDKIDPDGAKTSKPWEDYWRDWQANHPWLSPAQLDWCEQQLARGCVGVTCANLGAEEDLSRCYKKRSQAERKKRRMERNCECKTGTPRIFSVHLWNDKGLDGKRSDAKFGWWTGRANLSNWNRSGRPPGPWNPNPRHQPDPRQPSFDPRSNLGGVNFDYGFLNLDGTLCHADLYHNPDRDGDGLGDYYPEHPIRNATIFTSSLDEWQGGHPRYYQYPDFNREVWCVQCDGGSYGN